MSICRAKRLLSSVLIGGSLLIGLPWLVGQIASDRWWWSQWLLWIPSFLLCLAGLLLWAGLLLKRSKWHPVGVGLAIAGLLLFVLTHWSPGEPSTAPSIRILHWTAGPTLGKTEPYARFIVDTDADITIVEGARRAAADPAMRDWGAGMTLAMRGQFLIASRLPITRLRTVAWAHDILLFTLEVKKSDGNPLRLLIVDLPSSPDRDRGEIIDTAHRLLDRLDQEPDLILGDFNLTQASWQLRRFRAGYRPAWSAAGVGWGGTWPRTMPLYRLDHVLTKPNTRLASLATTDPACGGHRAQLIEVASGEPPEDEGYPPESSQ
ncbi:MAG: endonuclease/exonuclease/phosphatase family protein [Phycisphaerales bacterium]|nr:endonuclease/exonuclease/phosphatase family protein [Phycisphaerales bacterium]